MPSWPPYFPGTQGRQIAWPVSFWCLPRSHSVQLSEVAESAPLAQPRGHALHSVDLADLNLPAAQVVQVDLPFPLVLSPAEHFLQLVWSVSFVNVFAGQSLHVVRPCTSPYLPGMQGRQIAWPSAV